MDVDVDETIRLVGNIHRIGKAQDCTAWTRQIRPPWNDSTVPKRWCHIRSEMRM